MLSQHDAEQWAIALAARHAVHLEPIHWVPGATASIQRSPRGGQLSIGTDLLLDEGTAQFHIAHEIGHLALGHVRTRRQRLQVISPYLAAAAAAELAVILATIYWTPAFLLIPVVFIGVLTVLARRVVLPALHNPRCRSLGLKPPVSSSDRAM